MATTEILPFAGGVGANVITQAAYAALAAQTAGFSAGIAQSAQLNKVWRQSAFMAAGLATFMVNQGVSVPDDANLSALATNIATAFSLLVQASPQYCLDSGAANVYVATLAAAPAALTQDLTIDLKIAHTNTGASTLNANGLGAKAITYQGNALVGGELAIGQIYILKYDIATTSWQIVSNVDTPVNVYTAVSSTTGSANAQVIASVTPGGFTKTYGFIVNFTAGFANTSATTLNVSGTGATTIKKNGASGLADLAIGDLIVGDAYSVWYNGTFWVLIDVTFTPSNFLQVANNLSDLANATTARTNLGLGTSATHATGDFAQTANNLSDLASSTTSLVNLGILQGRGFVQLDKTSNTTLSAMTGLTVTLVSGGTYSIEAFLCTSANASGGAKAGFGGTAVAASYLGWGDAISGTSPQGGTFTTTLGTSIVGMTAASPIIKLYGDIVVTTGGTLNVLFAQNASFGTASSLLVGSWMRAVRIA